MSVLNKIGMECYVELARYVLYGNWNCY